MTAATTPAPLRCGPVTRPVIALVALGVVVLLIGGTLALWLATAGFRGGQITAGDLALTTGTATWQQVTPGVTNPQSGTLDGQPTDFVTMPGDVIEIAQPVTATLRGDNLVAGLSADSASGQVAQDVRDGLIAVSVRVEDSAGRQVAPEVGQVGLGQALEVPGLVGDADGVVSDWVVVIRVEVRGDYVWAGRAPVDVLGLWTAGRLAVRLEQLREGPGFTADAGAPTGPTRTGGAR